MCLRRLLSLVPMPSHLGPHMDKITPAKRSALMGRIRSRDTTPEIVVRSLLHRLGYRFRLHRKDLPGRPDIVLPRHGKIILVHGCFWHGHACPRASKPKSNQEYWRQKINGNRVRDALTKNALAHRGWSVLELWECELRPSERLEERVQAFMRR